MGTMDNFFGGTFFVQKMASHKDEFESMLPQVAGMDDVQILSQVSKLAEMEEDVLLSEVKRDYGWDKEKLLGKFRSYAQTHSKP